MYEQSILSKFLFLRLIKIAAFSLWSLPRLVKTYLKSTERNLVFQQRKNELDFPV